MNSDQLGRVMPLCDVAKWIAPLNEAMSRFVINTPLRKAAFLANIAVESNQLLILEENLNYTVSGLMRTWPLRFKDTQQTSELAKKPEKIANIVYANRMGNGDEASGDGFKYRGRGLIQITGKAAYNDAAVYFGVSITDILDWSLTVEGAAMSAAWMFSFVKRCNKLADHGDFDSICDLLNLGHKTGKVGDSVGYLNRLHFYDVAKEELSA